MLVCPDAPIRLTQVTEFPASGHLKIVWKGPTKVKEFLIDLWGFMRARKKFWLAPIILVMVALGGLIMLAQGSALAPFIYTLF